MRSRLLIAIFLLFPLAAVATTRIGSLAGGDFTAAATWNVVDTVGYMDSELGTQAIGTVNIDSPAFTWVAGAPTVLGVAIKVNSRMAVPAANTITCTLRDTTTPADVDAVTMNVSDIDNGPGWYMLDFGGGSAMVNGRNYIVRCIASAANAVTLYRSTTGTTNFSKMIVTDATGAPAAGDQLHVAAWWDVPNNRTDVVVTMDNNTTDSFGPTVAGGPPQGMTVNEGGTLIWKTNANTILYMKGITRVFSSGVMEIGTAGTPIGAFTAEFRMDSAANVDSGLVIDPGAVFYAYGPVKTVTSTLLTTNAVGGDDHIHVASTAGWAGGDVVVIASTSQTAAQAEKMSIKSVDSVTQVTFTANLANAHSGTVPTQAEVINLTRGVLIKGSATATQGYIVAGTSATVGLGYAELQFLGSNTNSKRGVNINTTTGSFALDRSSLHEFDVNGSVALLIGSAVSANITITDNVGYQMDSIFVTSTGAYTMTGSVWMKNVQTNAANCGIYLTGSSGTYSNNTTTSMTAASFKMENFGGTFNANVHHSNGSGILINGTYPALSLTNLTTWRNQYAGGAAHAIRLNAIAGGTLTIDGYTAFGNEVANLSIENTGVVLVNNMTSNGDSTFATTRGIQFGNIYARAVLTNSSFSQVAGILTAHTYDIYQVGTGGFYWTVQASNTLFIAGSDTVGTFLVGSPQGLSLPPIGVYSMHHQATDGDNRRFLQSAGRARTDTGVVRTGTPSERLTPYSASIKMASGVQSQNVANGATVTFSAWVRKSVVGDGGTDPAAANYNGAEPRLILKANPAMGINADVVLDTMTAAIGNWELLTGASAAVTDAGILQAYVDCDGTTGWVNVDDWNGATTGANWSEGYPLVLPTGGAGGGTTGSAWVQ